MYGPVRSKIFFATVLILLDTLPGKVLLCGCSDVRFLNRIERQNRNGTESSCELDAVPKHRERSSFTMSTTDNSAHVSIPAVKAVEESANQKIGPVSATMASQASCSSECPFLGSGCYANGGNQGIHTSRLNQSSVIDPVKIAECEAAAIDTLTGARPLRLHVVGDVTTDETAKIIAEAARTYRRRGARVHEPEHGPAAVWTYTHSWRQISRRSFGLISALASCETTAQVRKARGKGYATSIVVDRFERPTAYVKDGIKIVPCPQQTGKSQNCTTCRLCWNDWSLRETGVTIGFEAHGMQANIVRKQLIQISLEEKKTFA